jgi:hypothetical protein
MNQEEKICSLEIEIAVLRERIKRLEAIVYGVIGFASLQLVGLFIMWAYQIFKGK